MAAEAKGLVSMEELRAQASLAQVRVCRGGEHIKRQLDCGGAGVCLMESGLHSYACLSMCLLCATGVGVCSHSPPDDATDGGVV